MAQGHSVDEYLETIYFLAFPIGEYRPNSPGSPTLAARVAEMLRVSRASAGEMLKRLEAEAHVHADELGDTFTDDMVERIDDRLGHPERCPHGWPVDPDLEQAEKRELAPLADLEPPTQATVIRLAEHDGELLHWFYDQGLTPGTELKLQAAEPAAGQFTVRVDGTEKAIGEKAA